MNVVLHSEIAMQQVWRFRLWGTSKLSTSQSKIIQVLDPGKLNTGPGPDFRDARIRVDGETWIGSVEVHRRASDWHRHGHDGDAAYSNVILHVVGEDDCRIERNDGSEILQAVMEIGPEFDALFNGLLTSVHYVLPMCGNSLNNVADIFKTDWLTALAFERMQRKSGDVERRLKAEKGDWFQAVYVTLARGLGFGINADNMERLARCTPFRRLLRHSDNVETIESLLFGQAGLLDFDCPRDYYEAELGREYRFYAHKYQLRPMDRPIWQMSTRNITNTPYRRIALLAKLVATHGSDLAYSLYKEKALDDVRTFFNVPLSEYWMYAWAFGRETAKRMSPLGQQSLDLMVINVMAPLIYCRGLQTNKTELMDSAMDFWMKIAGEKNSITKGFERYGVMSPDAFSSQALIQLHKEYCERRRCPECRLGHRLLSAYVDFKGC